MKEPLQEYEKSCEELRYHKVEIGANRKSYDMRNEKEHQRIKHVIHSSTHSLSLSPALTFNADDLIAQLRLQNGILDEIDEIINGIDARMHAFKSPDFMANLRERERVRQGSRGADGRRGTDRTVRTRRTAVAKSERVAWHRGELKACNWSAGGQR